jgi:hypothetical protein
MREKDPYRILNLSSDASDGEVRRAYRRLALLYHPDLNPGDKGIKDRFRRVQEAYRALRGSGTGVRYQAGATLASPPDRRMSPLLAGLRPGADAGADRSAPVDFFQASDRRLDDLAITDLLARLQEAENRFVRAAAIQALSRRDSPDAIRAVVACVRGGPPALRHFALDCFQHTIKHLGLRVIPAAWEGATVIEKYQLLLTIEELRLAVPPDFLDVSAAGLPRFLRARLERLCRNRDSGRSGP